MMIGNEIQDLEKFKAEATKVLESGKFSVHKWESNVSSLESTNMLNPEKISGHVWNKSKDTVTIQVQHDDYEKLTKKAILSTLWRIYDPLGIISPTMVEGKRVYRDSCEEGKNWNAEVSPTLKRQWDNWTKQLRDIEIPRSLVPVGTTKAVDFHLFVDASTMACSTVAIAVVEQEATKSKGFLESNSRLSKRNTSIPRLELVRGQMGANLARNLTRALKRLPLRLTVIWMDSLVSLYCILYPGKLWKTYCPTANTLADLGSRGASLHKMET